MSKSKRPADRRLLRFDIRAFGPIAQAEFELRPLTVFVGANNTGKSTAAVACRAFFGLVGRGHHRDYYGVPEGWWELLQESARYGLTRRRRRPGARLSPPDRKGGEVTLAEFSEKLPSWVHERLRLLFCEELQDRFSRKLEGLVRRPSTDCRKQPADIRIGYGQDFEFGLRILSSGEAKAAGGKLVLNDEVRKALHRTGRGRYFLPPTELETGWTESLPPIDRSAYYLPAARSGLLQSHRLLMRMLVRRAGQVGRDPFSVPTLPGSVAGFVDDLLRINPGRRLGSGRRREEVRAVADWISTRTTGGRIVAEPSEEQPDIFEIMYRTDDSSFGLEGVSSSIAEVAPIVLFIRHLVSPGDLLVIEEPEAHLHPENQRQLARGIARLVNAGVRVLVTTHSDYLLQQFGNLVRHGRQEERDDGAAGLDPVDVGVYDFFKDGQLGTRTREVRVSGEEGIEEEEFRRVSEELYEEAVSLDYRGRR